ncbi:histidine phosphatase family protein [Arenibaculum pallidiluteum]|uniref:histidine phosphatase family protein n=1 Tax=Arenibaculum pallidiluteum TaxID=2812559 RepID=UPI001A958BA9|nr:histidine phosphatase family protein [Arenibaculum pallidiluteum]
MTMLLLVRHAATDWIGRGLAGRTEIGLSAEGSDQARRLAPRLAALRPDLALSSPRRRCLDTAAPMAERTGLLVGPVPGLDEVDFGSWTGAAFEALRDDPAWQAWNANRSGARCPGGESMAEAQLRAIGLCQRLSIEQPDARIVLFSHADIIRSVLAFWLGMPLDLLLRLDIDPASVSRVELAPWGPRILAVNETLPP